MHSWKRRHLLLSVLTPRWMNIGSKWKIQDVWIQQRHFFTWNRDRITSNIVCSKKYLSSICACWRHKSRGPLHHELSLSYVCCESYWHSALSTQSSQCSGDYVRLLPVISPMRFLRRVALWDGRQSEAGQMSYFSFQRLGTPNGKVAKNSSSTLA